MVQSGIQLIRTIVVVIALATCVHADGFFEPAKNAGDALPADQIYPHGRVFPFSFFSVGTSDIALEQYAKDGFTMIGPQYELNETSPQDAAKVGLKAIYSIGSDKNGKNWLNFLADTPVTFDPKEIEERVNAQVSAVAHDPAIAWWYIEPEELRHWRENEMLYLKIVSDAIRRNDPKQRPIWMYEPNHRTADAMAMLLKCIDVSGKGAYTNHVSQSESRIWVRWTVEQEIKAIRQSGRNGLFAILVPEMFEQPAADHESMIPAWVRHDVYLGLVCGAKGIVVYSMGPRNGFEAYQAYYAAYAEAAGQLTGPEGLGQVFMFGEARNDFRVEVMEGPETLVQKDNFGAELGEPVVYPSITWMDAAYRNERYLFAVNSANMPVKVKITGLPPVAVNQQDLFQQSGSARINAYAFETVFQPLEVKGWRFSALGED